MTYFLDRQSSVGHFKIHPDTGELTVSELLDREEQDKFNLIVQVRIGKVQTDWEIYVG